MGLHNNGFKVDRAPQARRRLDTAFFGRRHYTLMIAAVA